MDNRVEGERGWGAAAEGIFEVCFAEGWIAKMLSSDRRTDVCAARFRAGFEAQVSEENEQETRFRGTVVWSHDLPVVYMIRQ